MSSNPEIQAAVPTVGPWSIEDDCLVQRSWRYNGWPHFGRIVVVRFDGTWPQGPERQANLELVASAVNGCFTVAPQHPIAAANGLPALVAAVEDFLTLGNDPNMPQGELKGRLERAFRQARGGAS